MKKIKILCVTANLIFFGVCTKVLADDELRDSNADATGFSHDIQNTHGVVLRVLINDKGEENTAEAIMRMDQKETPVTASSDLRTIWDDSKPIDDATQLSTDTPIDSSTWGWYGYRGYNGWVQPYYYRSYYPSAYYYGNLYNYAPRYYSSYYYPNYGYGYRYYYYGY